MPKWVSYDIFRHFKYYLSAAANRFAGLKMEEKMIFTKFSFILPLISTVK
jgi:hypothetical protein